MGYSVVSSMDKMTYIDAGLHIWNLRWKGDKKMNDNKMEYQTTQFMPMTDFELQSVNGGGIPVVVFILVAAVTVVEAAFLVGAAVAWDVAVGTVLAVSTSEVTKS